MQKKKPRRHLHVPYQNTKPKKKKILQNENQLPTKTHETSKKKKLFTFVATGHLPSVFLS
jgi:hypothetical protein